MRRAPLRYGSLLPKEKLAHLRELERNFHVRAFGEEMARVNLDMTKEQRLRYLDWMHETGRRHGVKPTEKFPYDRDFEE